MARTSGTQKTRTIGDEAVTARTGRNWAQWFKLLDAAGAKQLDHRGIVALLSTRYDVGSWWRQTITVEYERARGKRLVHQRPTGFEVSASKTMPVPISLLYLAWTDAAARRRWLAGVPMTIRGATKNKRLRITWDRDDTRVEVAFYARGGGKSQLTVQHGRLPNAAAAAKTKAYWKGRLGKLVDIFDATG